INRGAATVGSEFVAQLTEPRLDNVQDLSALEPGERFSDRGAPPPPERPQSAKRDRGGDDRGDDTRRYPDVHQPRGHRRQHGLYLTGGTPRIVERNSSSLSPRSSIPSFCQS